MIEELLNLGYSPKEYSPLPPWLYEVILNTSTAYSLER